MPVELWRSMGRSQSIQITAPLDARVEFLLEDYKHLMADPERLNPLLDWAAARVGSDAVLVGERQLLITTGLGSSSAFYKTIMIRRMNALSAKHGHKDICLLKLKVLYGETLPNLLRSLHVSLIEKSSII